MNRHLRRKDYRAIVIQYVVVVVFLTRTIISEEK